MLGRQQPENPKENEQPNKTRSNDRERVMTLAVLCLLLVSTYLASLVDDHAQSSPARKLLAQCGFEGCLESRFDVLPGEGGGHRDCEVLGSHGHRSDAPEPHPHRGGIYLGPSVIENSGPEFFSRRVGRWGRGCLGMGRLRFAGDLCGRGGLQRLLGWHRDRLRGLGESVALADG